MKYEIELVVGLFNGLLLPAVVAGSASALQRPQRDAKSQHQNVGRHLEAGHVLLQRQKVVRSHHHSTQQTAAHQTRRKHPLLRQVPHPHSITINHSTFQLDSFNRYQVHSDAVYLKSVFSYHVRHLHFIVVSISRVIRFRISALLHPSLRTNFAASVHKQIPSLIRSFQIRFQSNYSKLTLI